jgi:hypothetical protein
MKKVLFITLLICISNNINAQKKVQSEGITSSTHQKYLNKIVFASDYESLKKKSENETNFKNEFEFNPDIKIFYRAYFDNSIYNYIRPLAKGDGAKEIKNYAIAFNYYIDDVLSNQNQKNVYNSFEEDEIKNFTTFRGAFKNNEKEVYCGEELFEKFLDANTDLLSTGKHKIKIEIYPVLMDNSDEVVSKFNVIAVGEFYLNAKNFVLDPNDEKLCLGKNLMNDTALIKKIATAYSSGDGYKTTTNDIRILSSSWKTERNQYSGIIEGRSILILVGYKDTKNKICSKRYYTVYQDYIGSKFTDTIKFKWNEAVFPEQINCKCINQ